MPWKHASSLRLILAPVPPLLGARLKRAVAEVTLGTYATATSPLYVIPPM